jgi:hypothetical protein
MNMRFEIEVDGQLREAEVRFGGEEEARLLTRWRYPAGLRVEEPIADALEYARLACKRWRHYRRAGATVSSGSELRTALRRNPKAEVAMLLVARPGWRSPTSILGFAYFRRTWCHHFVVDFLAVHPRVIAGRPERIRRVGSGLLDQLVGLAEEMEVPCIWGEATANSAPFYERTLHLEQILDHFFIEDEVMTYCRERLHRERAQMLARREIK